MACTNRSAGVLLVLLILLSLNVASAYDAALSKVLGVFRGMRTLSHKLFH